MQALRSRPTPVIVTTGQTFRLLDGARSHGGHRDDRVDDRAGSLVTIAFKYRPFRRETSNPSLFTPGAFFILFWARVLAIRGWLWRSGLRARGSSVAG